MQIQEDPGVAELAATERGRGVWAWIRALPLWEKALLAIAVGAVAAGGVMTLVGGDAVPPDGADALGASLTTEGPSASAVDGAAGPAEEVSTSKGVFRLGFSFLAGFCVGLFLRAVLKLAAVAVGFWMVMTFALSYAGLVVVDWDAAGALWDSFAAVFETEWDSFQSFMLGSLPATSLAITGLAVGFRRR